MKREFACTACLLAALALNAQGTILVRGPIGAAGAVNPSGDLIDEDFEGTGAPSGWTTPNAFGAADWDNTTAGTFSHGSQSFKTTADAGGGYVYKNFTGSATSATVYVNLAVYFDEVPASDKFLVSLDVANDGAARATLKLGASGVLRICANDGSTVTVSTSAGMSVNTLYYIKWYVNHVTGVGSVEFSTTYSFSGSGSNYASYTGSTATSVTMGEIALYNQLTTNKLIYFDNVKASTTAIP